jgi:hypothetical protein
MTDPSCPWAPIPVVLMSANCQRYIRPVQIDRTRLTIVADQYSRLDIGDRGLTTEKMKDCVWFSPGSCGTVRRLEWTGADHLRFTKFVAIGDGRDPRKIVRETSHIWAFKLSDRLRPLFNVRSEGILIALTFLSVYFRNFFLVPGQGVFWNSGDPEHDSLCRFY